MRVTIDLDRDIIIIPDNFFKKISEENEKLEKYGAKPVKAIERIKRSFEEAMKDTDNRLLLLLTPLLLPTMHLRIRNNGRAACNTAGNRSNVSVIRTAWQLCSRRACYGA